MSPPRINPESFASMAPALVRQYGIGLLFAGVFAIAAEKIYSDLREQTATLISLVREQSAASREVADALREIVHKIDKR